MGKIHDRFKKEQIGRHFAMTITNGGGSKGSNRIGDGGYGFDRETSITLR